MVKEKISNKVKAHTRYKLACGEPIPGVTTITNQLDKPMLKLWANRIGLQGIEMSKYVDEKADIGTCGHYLILCHNQKIKPDLNEYSQANIDLAENCFLSYLNWEKQHKVEPIKCELELVSEQYKFGGCLDMIAIVDGILTLVDFKTGSGIYDEMFYQVAGGYMILAREHGYKIEQIKILNIPRVENEQFLEANKTNTVLYEKLFLKLLDVYFLRKEIKNG